MNPFKTFEVNGDNVIIDDVVVMTRPKYMSRSTWIDFWTAAATIGGNLL